MDLQSQKQTLRRKLEARRRRLSPDDSARAGAAAAEIIRATPEFEQAAVIALYAALRGEVDTRPLFELATRAGKRICAPRSCEPPRLEFAAFARWEELQPGAFGVLEPGPELAVLTLTANDLVVVPGVAFDAAGGRLGRGAGHYDRTFPAAQPDSPQLFGLAFSFQVLAEVPAGCHDRRMDAICTEEGLLRTPRERGLA